MVWHLENPQENSLMSSWHTFKLPRIRDVRNGTTILDSDISGLAAL